MEKDNINQEVEKEKEVTEKTVEQEDISKNEKTSEKKEEAKENPETDKEDKKKKKGFKKKDKKDEQIEELNDKYQRLFAEFQNFRNRSEKEKTAMYETGARSIIEKILPVVDNFERGVAALSEEDLDSPVGQGMNLIYKQMLQTLEDMGVEAIEAKGNEFDPMLHNAVMHEDNDELGENIVSEELQKRLQIQRHSYKAQYGKGSELKAIRCL